MRAKHRFEGYIADICMKIFQIVFAMLVVGMLLRNRFDVNIFGLGIFVSLFTLTAAIMLYYDSTIREEKDK